MVTKAASSETDIVSLIDTYPLVAIALAGSSSDFRRARAGHTDLFCLPLFSAWVDTPDEPNVSRPLSEEAGKSKDDILDELLTP